MSIDEKEKIYLYEMTKYPEIYKNIYWGKFKIIDESKREYYPYLLEIFKNRDNFVEYYDIVRKVDGDEEIYFKYNNGTMDHIEQYITKNKSIIIVNSPYMSRKAKDEELCFYKKNGWIEIFKLYTPTTRTFIKIEDTKHCK